MGAALCTFTLSDARAEIQQVLDGLKIRNSNLPICETGRSIPEGGVELLSRVFDDVQFGVVFFGIGSPDPIQAARRMRAEYEKVEENNKKIYECASFEDYQINVGGFFWRKQIGAQNA